MSTPEPAVDGSTAGPCTVLLVEDEQPVRELVRIMLEREGHQVIEAATPDDALTLTTGPPAVDLLVTDVVMPGMSGFDLFRALSGRMPRLRVLFMSGYPDWLTLDATLAADGAAFLEKPFTSDVLVAKVRGVLADRKAP